MVASPLAGAQLISALGNGFTSFGTPMANVAMLTEKISALICWRRGLTCWPFGTSIAAIRLGTKALMMAKRLKAQAALGLVTTAATEELLAQMETGTKQMARQEATAISMRQPDGTSIVGLAVNPRLR